MTEDYTVEQLNNGRKVYNFLRYGKSISIASLLLVVISVGIILAKGFNWGLDFTGGSVAEIQLSKPADLELIRAGLTNAGFKDPIVQNFGSSRDIMVRMAPVTSVENDVLSLKIMEVIHSFDKDAVQVRIEFVGPSVGAEMAQSGSMGIIVCLLCILAYISFRFEWRLAVGTVLALVHDVVVTLGILSLFEREIDLTIIAALLSIIGYSLNDTIVVFDRMRENFRKIRRGTPYELMNTTHSQTLSRTLMTSGTTLIVVLCLYFYGGSLIQGFAETLSIGIVLGTYSSIWVASYVALILGLQREHMIVQKVEKEGADQPSLLP